jgi:Mn-dependent DtxR family transcriptional regulator
MQLTKEEKLILSVAKLALQRGSIESEVPAAAIIEALAVTPSSFWNMFNGLARANFLKKTEEEEIWLTPQGLALVEEIDFPLEKLQLNKNSPVAPGKKR